MASEAPKSSGFVGVRPKADETSAKADPLDLSISRGVEAFVAHVMAPQTNRGSRLSPSEVFVLRQRFAQADAIFRTISEMLNKQESGQIGRVPTLPVGETPYTLTGEDVVEWEATHIGMEPSDFKATWSEEIPFRHLVGDQTSTPREPKKVVYSTEVERPAEHIVSESHIKPPTTPITAATPFQLTTGQFIGGLAAVVGSVIAVMLWVTTTLATKTELASVQTDVKVLSENVQKLAIENARISERLDRTREDLVSAVQALKDATKELQDVKRQLASKTDK